MPLCSDNQIIEVLGVIFLYFFITVSGDTSQSSQAKWSLAEHPNRSGQGVPDVLGEARGRLWGGSGRLEEALGGSGRLGAAKSL